MLYINEYMYIFIYIYIIDTYIYAELLWTCSLIHYWTLINLYFGSGFIRKGGSGLFGNEHEEIINKK